MGCFQLFNTDVSMSSVDSVEITSVIAILVSPSAGGGSLTNAAEQTIVVEVTLHFGSARTELIVSLDRLSEVI